VASALKIVGTELLHCERSLLTSAVHLYFLTSPFCDATSNNKIINVQSQRNPALYDDLRDRTRFEERLEKINGIEYRIVEGPLRTTPDMNPVWVIRKQNRQKRFNEDGTDKLTILGTYFAIAEHIYQAPSLYDILLCKMVRLNSTCRG
jgi:mediator of RNA polymerase II transcription subunit 6